MNKTSLRFYVVLLSACLALFALGGCAKAKDNGAQNKNYILSLVNDSYTLEEGDSKKLDFLFLDGNISADASLLTFSSSNNSIATVSGGVITGVSAGSCTVTVSYGEKSKTASVTVKQKASVGDETPDEPIIGAGEATQTEIDELNRSAVRVFGRTYRDNTNGGTSFDNVSSGVELLFRGTEIKMNVALADNNGQSVYIRVFVDNDKDGDFVEIENGATQVTLANNLSDNLHKLRVIKSSESVMGRFIIKGFQADSFEKLPSTENAPKMIFIGDSISCGYGVLAASSSEAHSRQNSDGSKSYAYLTASALNADVSVIAMSGICLAFNTAYGQRMDDLYKKVSYNNRVDYDFSGDFDKNADYVVINLGTNDLSQINNVDNPDATAEAFGAAYKSFLEFLLTAHPKAKIICAYGMMNNNSVITNAVSSAISSLTSTDKSRVAQITLPQNTSAANGHPSQSGQAAAAKALVEYIGNM